MEWDIKSNIPHRAPMLLVDEIKNVKPMESITTRFHVKKEMEIFQGHFPRNPVLPGIYSIEIMAQTADLLIMTDKRYRGKVPLLIGVDEAKFFSKIVPDDMLLINCKVVSENEEKAIIKCYSEIYNGDVLADSCFVTLAMR